MKDNCVLSARILANGEEMVLCMFSCHARASMSKNCQSSRPRNGKNRWKEQITDLTVTMCSLLGSDLVFSCALIVLL